MPFIRFVNEIDHKTYDGEEGLKNLIYYIFSQQKTGEDTKRPIMVMDLLRGCNPFIAPREYETDPDYVFELMAINNRIFHAKDSKDVVKHRIISFHPSEYVLPNDVNQLGKALVSFYADNGYIAAYGLHMDTYHIHCHIAVDTISYMNGNRFHIHSEYLKVQTLAERWFADHLSSLDQSYKKKETYENALFGDNNRAYGAVALDAKGQIYNNKCFHNGKRA